MSDTETLHEVEAPMSAEDSALWDDVVNSMNGEPVSAEPDEQDVEDEEPEAQEPEPEQEEEAKGPTIEELIAEREALQRERDDWRHRYQSDQGRFLAAQRKLADLHNQQRQQESAQEPEGQRQQAAAGVQAMKDGRFAQFAEEFPEMAEAITEYFNSQKTELLSTFNQHIEPVKQWQQVQIEQEEQAAFNRAVNELATRHPDWEQYNRASNAEFDQWLSAQPAEIQSIYGRPDPYAASRLIDFYKSEKGMAQSAPGASSRAEKLQAQRQQKLERSTLPTTKGGSVTNTDPDDALWASVLRQVEGKR